jgi:hypothetical protein
MDFSLYRFVPFPLVNGSHKVHTVDAKNAKKCRVFKYFSFFVTSLAFIVWKYHGFCQRLSDCQSALANIKGYPEHIKHTSADDSQTCQRPEGGAYISHSQRNESPSGYSHNQ